MAGSSSMMRMEGTAGNYDRAVGMAGRVMVKVLPL